MKYFLSVAVLSSFALAGCGGSDAKEEPAAPLSQQYYGMWQHSNIAYVAVSEKTITTYTYDAERACYENGLFNVVSSTASSAVTSDVLTGEQEKTTFSLNGSNLVLAQDGLQLEFSQHTSGLFITPGCESFHNVNTINIALELNYLPPAITINRTAQSTGRVEYDYAIEFDLNKNGVIDAGDISLSNLHFKSSDLSRENEQTTLADLKTAIWLHLPKHQQSTIYTTSLSTDLLNVNQSGNTLFISANTDMHPSLAHINADTPVRITTYINYPAPEFTVINSWQDGPWNWSSETHSDTLPDQLFTKASDHPNMLIVDATSDLTSGESQWVDIKSVKFTFN